MVNFGRAVLLAIAILSLDACGVKPTAERQFARGAAADPAAAEPGLAGGPNTPPAQKLLANGGFELLGGPPPARTARRMTLARGGPDASFAGDDQGRVGLAAQDDTAVAAEVAAPAPSSSPTKRRPDGGAVDVREAYEQQVSDTGPRPGETDSAPLAAIALWQGGPALGGGQEAPDPPKASLASRAGGIAPRQVVMFLLTVAAAVGIWNLRGRSRPSAPQRPD